MRATEIIRGVLDLIDQIECQHEPAVDQIEPAVASFKDVFAQLTGEPKPPVYDNSPDIVVKDVAAVTTAAGLGGLTGPKNPADIKSNSISMFPNHLHRPGE